MPETPQPSPGLRPPAGGTGSIAASLRRRGRGWLPGWNSDRAIRSFFQGNALVSILVLGLITLTLFRDALDFIPQNRRNLELYRLSGKEAVDILRRHCEDHAVLGRELTQLRQESLAELTLKRGLSAEVAAQRLATYDAFAEEFSTLVDPLRDLLSQMTDLTSALRDRAQIAGDLTEARETYRRKIEVLRSRPMAAADAASTIADVDRLQREYDAIVVEPIDFRAELAPLRELFPAVRDAAAATGPACAAVLSHAPEAFGAPAARRLERFRENASQWAVNGAGLADALESWQQDKPVSRLESFQAFLFGRTWVTASFWQDWYGVLPLLSGSLVISVLALAIAIPFGVCAAIYVNQVAGPREQKIVKPLLEFISAIPSVVLGFFGVAVLGTLLREVSQVGWLQWFPGFPMSERLTAATAACLLALMAVPTIFSLAEDAINNVPRSFAEASYACGATRLQTILLVVVPGAVSGIFAAVLLGFGRVLGETMVVLVCAGNRIQTPDFAAGLGVFFQPVHTMTGIIAQEMGEVVRGSLHYRALFMVGCLLFLLSLAINYGAQRIVRRYRLPGA